MLQEFGKRVRTVPVRSVGMIGSDADSADQPGGSLGVPVQQGPRGDLGPLAERSTQDLLLVFHVYGRINRQGSQVFIQSW